MFAASASSAQVTATATVKLTIVPAPGMNFIPSVAPTVLSRATIGSEGVPEQGMTFRSPGNVLVQLNSVNAVTSRFNMREGQVKTFTARQLHNAARIEIEYLGS